MTEELTQGFCDTIIQKYKDVKLQRPVYVIHEHHAKRLHWDLRLEMDNVLKSWALPKGAPLEGERRLAVQVEDHPLEYAAFEGTIPEGNYGAGEVMIWDNGTFDIESRKEKKIIVNIHGKKLKGRYCLLHFRPNEKNWLFFKVKD
ncbi:MAG: DNA ligase D-like protein (predicted 3'-phosphoesterase) [Candidatus Nitrosomirales archaeon]|jgi:DNA ligase D-like protein (predicted 3'-phosphoesterase)